MKAQHTLAGYGAMSAAIRFVQWVKAQHEFPTPERVMARFACSYATANRWLNAYADANDIDRPRRGSWRAAA